MENEESLNDYEKYQTTLEEARKIAEKIQKVEDNIVIATVANVDNLCAAGILVGCLKNVSIGNHIIVSNKPSDLKKRLNRLNYKTYFIIGLIIEEIPSQLINDETKTIFLVNHKLKTKNREENSAQRIHILSLQDKELPQNKVSNAGLVYFIASWIEEDFEKYSSLAIVGALAKKQVNPDNQELIEWNKIILEQGIEKDYLEKIKGTRIPGRENQPIHLALKYSINPYFPGLTGNESACTSFVSRLGIAMKDQEGKWRTIASLSKKETKALNDALISLLVEKQNQSTSDFYKLIGPIYVISNEKKGSRLRNAEEFLWFIEGACQLKKYSLALAVILGERKNIYDKLVRDLSNYHGKAAEIIEQILQDQTLIEEQEYYRIICGDKIINDETIAVASNALVDSGMIPIDKPLLTYFQKKNDIICYVRDSKKNIIKGIRAYHIFNKMRKNKENKANLIKELGGEIEFFKVVVDKKHLKELLEQLHNEFEYHFKGSKKENSEEDILNEDSNEKQ
ncbi:MAG: hypothetical protein ACTSX6_07075 [Candidatus Heimdallarchaeaceae archaeon]